MNLASLYSGGKDSTFSLFKALSEGNTVSCLITILPSSDESPFFHFPNACCTLLQAECLGMPLISTKARSESKEDELAALKQALYEAKQTFAIEGIVTGGLGSQFQQDNFRSICNELSLEYYSPSWGADQREYMYELIANDFKIMIVGVSAAGLTEKWLGAIIDEHTLKELEVLSRKHGFGIAFEGGEAETFVLDCPIFKKKIEIKKAEKHWDGYRGYLEIERAEVVSK